MPLLRNGRADADDPWVRLDDDAPLPSTATGRPAGLPESSPPAPVLLGLARFLAEAAGGTVATGVLLAPDDDPLVLAPYLGRLQLVAVDFPVYTDGRGYSHARLLRERLGYGGEVRAIGDVRVDQLAFMVRAGFDTFDLVDEIDAATLHAALSRYRTSYQPSYALAIAG